jgi:hypothetical protein
MKKLTENLKKLQCLTEKQKCVVEASTKPIDEYTEKLLKRLTEK